MSENWLPIAGWDSLYEVSSEGRVRSVPRMVNGGNGSRAVRGGRILKQSVTRGYAHVTLSDRTRTRNARIHVLVASAFLGPRPDGLNACHRNGDSANNAASNLYWGTQLENIHDKRAHGTDSYALKRGCCKHGHPFTKENTYITRTGSPVCRTCRREGMRTRKATA